jgi:putative ABC transport system ATP-binding protein
MAAPRKKDVELSDFRTDANGEVDYEQPHHHKSPRKKKPQQPAEDEVEQDTAVNYEEQENAVARKQRRKKEVAPQDEYFGDTRVEQKSASEASEDTIVFMNNVHKTYLLGIEGVPALRGVSLSVKRGEFVCIFGTSGGGKTTMLNIMGTIDKPTKGELKLCGTLVNSNTKDSTLSELRLKKIGFVFQTFNLLGSMTALENVEMPMTLNGILSPSARRQRAKELLNMVGMGPRLGHVPAQLSGGEQQRVTIARAMANSPELLLLDEPTGDLDTVNTLNVMRLLTELNQNHGVTMVMVTHDVALKSYADRVVWMRDGKIQRIDQVRPEKKREALQALHLELEEIQRKRAIKKRSEPVTEMRIPTDYHTHPKFQQREIPVVQASQEQKDALVTPSRRRQAGEGGSPKVSRRAQQVDEFAEAAHEQPSPKRSGKAERAPLEVEIHKSADLDADENELNRNDGVAYEESDVSEASEASIPPLERKRSASKKKSTR